MFTRRDILKILGTVMGMVSFGKITLAKQKIVKEAPDNPVVTIQRAVNGNPAANLKKVIELLGGIEKIIGADDVVVIKPNVQWWNQGVPNLAAMKALVDIIMNRPGGFGGESLSLKIVIAVCNHQTLPGGRMIFPEMQI